MKYLLDTNTCINYLHGTSEKIKFHFEEKSQTDIAICSTGCYGMENLFKFKAGEKFKRRHTGRIPSIKFLYQRRNWVN